MEVGCAAFLFGIVAIIALIVAVRAQTRVSRLSEEITRLRDALTALGHRVSDLRVHAPSETKTEPKPEPAAAPQQQPQQPPPKAEPKPVIAPPAPKPVVTPPAPPPPPPKPHAAAPPPLSPQSSVLSPKKPPFDWESLVGVKLFSWIAGVALVLAALFFLSYSVQHGWLSPIVRATIGMITGIGLLVLCELRYARQYKLTADALDGAGVAILYATLFATHALWHLLPASAVFALMILVTAVAVVLSIRRNSVFIALLGLLGGFATPALLSTGENKPLALFSYLLLLNIGLAWVATTKRWPVLTAITVLFTAVYEWGWLAKFLTASQLPIAAAIFAVFAIAAGSALWIGRKDDGSQTRFDHAAIAGAALPLFFAIFAAAVPAYGARFNILFGFLLLVTAALGIISAFREPQWLNVLGGVATVLVFVVWFSMSYTPSAWPMLLAWLAIFIVVQLVTSHFNASPPLTVAPVLFLVFAILATMEKATASPGLFFTVVFAMLALVAAYAMIHETGILYFIAAFFTIATEAIWSAKYLDDLRLHAALIVYGVFALLFLGIPMLARRLKRRLEPTAAITVLLMLSIAMLLFLAVGPVAKVALWGMSLLLMVINAGAMFEARRSSNPFVSALAVILSWIVIGVWYASAATAVNIIPALAVVGAFGALAVAGNVWGSRGSDAANDFGNGVFLALAGHMFLIFVAAERSLGFPPWPLFAVLAVLDLAIGVAAIYLKRGPLMIGAGVASQIVLIVWTATATVRPWTTVALVATIVVAAFTVIWFAISRTFAAAAVITLILGEIVAIVAGFSSAPPALSALTATHALLVITLLVVLTKMEWHDVAPPVVAIAAIATALMPAKLPMEQFLVAAPFYVIFIAYPAIAAPRAKRALAPFLAAVLESAAFFFFVRHAMLGAGMAKIIGILPVFEAGVLLLLVYQLLRLEPRGERNLTRLAIVCAAALAFITAAIPLQLDKQWITLGWALEAAALVWLFRRIPHRGLLLWSGGLFVAVFARLVFNPAVFAYHPVSHAAIVNWYLYTYLVAAAAFFIGAKLLPSEQRVLVPSAVPALASGGTILLFFLVNIEIADFYSGASSTITFNFLSSSLAQDLTYTICWALFAVGMLIAGIALRSRGTRIAAIVLLLATVLKCFLHDLARLGGLYRVASLLGLAISLVLVGVLLQRFVMPRHQMSEETP